MSVNRKKIGASSRRFIERFDHWRPDPSGFANIYRDALAPGEAERKWRRYSKLVEKARAQARARLDPERDPQTIVLRIAAKMTDASLYYLFSRDRKALAWAREALAALERYPRPHFCYITLVGTVDIDLVTAAVTCALAAMRSCFAGELDAPTARRMERVAVDRCLGPALEALRTDRYWWCRARHNWRSVMTGSFGRGAMAFADVFPDWRALVEYGIDGVLVVLDSGDRTGGWQEGPGYWEYGIGHCAEFAAALGVFTGGKVDLFRHSFLRRAGDFRISMAVAPDRVWNWSDCGKEVAGSLTLGILARRYRDSAYQQAALSGGPTSLREVFNLDPDLEGAAPTPATGFPLTRIFPDIDVAVMRTGFGANDAFVGVKGGTLGPTVNHEHADLGSLVIHAAGRELLAETDRWPYAQATGKAGGFFEKSGRRWDFDGNAPLAHNIALPEGRHPPFDSMARARLRHADLGSGREVVEVEATAMHRAVARRVRRLVVYLRPDAVLLVDEILANAPIRARSLFHYLERGETDSDSFRIASGKALLRGWSIHPSIDDNIIIGRDERRVTYHTERGMVAQTNKYLYTENVHRARRVIFLTALRFGAAPLEPLRWNLDGDPDASGPFTVTLSPSGKTHRLRIDLAARDLARKVAVRL